MRKILTLLSALVLLTFSACKKEKGPSEELKKQAISNYANVVYNNYSDALAKAQILKTKVDAFVANPTQAGFDEAKQAWLDARVPYGQTEVYRFYGGPIDDVNGPEGLLNAWPMDESFVDYVQGNANAGIINNLVTYPSITKSLIESLNESGGETNISCGYHAVEFLLWGQDFSASAAGSRPYTDYLTSGGTANNQARRGEYLKACTDLIVEHLQYVTDAWAPNSNNYRKDFENGNTDLALTHIIQGMGFLSKGELAGERLEVAYDSQLSEDEHSCFSDNTHTDVRMNALGIKNVFFGSYTKSDGSTISGTGIYEIIKAKDTDLGEELEEDIEQSVEACNDILAPFDQQILGSNTSGRQTVKTAIDKLKAQGDKIAVAAQALGLNITVE